MLFNVNSNGTVDINQSQLQENKTYQVNVMHEMDKMINTYNNAITLSDFTTAQNEFTTMGLDGSNGQILKTGQSLYAADIKTVANWFIFMLIFVFDPLAITLVIATNQAFEQRKPKINIYGEPKPIEPEPVIETPSVSREMIEKEKQAIQNEIDKINRSGVSGRRAAPAIEQLQNRLRDLDNIQ